MQPSGRGLCALVTRWVDGAGLANSLCQKLSHNSLDAFANELRAQSGKSISADHARALIDCRQDSAAIPEVHNEGSNASLCRLSATMGPADLKSQKNGATQENLVAAEAVRAALKEAKLTGSAVRIVIDPTSATRTKPLRRRMGCGAQRATSICALPSGRRCGQDLTSLAAFLTASANCAMRTC